MVDVVENNADTEKLFHSAVGNWHADARVRREVRKRVRYEFINNSYVRGMVRTKQVDLIGTGPKIYVLHEDREAAAEIEDKFRQWILDIEAARKLRSTVFEWLTGGEGFAMMATNEASPNPVKLDIIPLDPEQIADESDLGKNFLEGIKYNDFGQAISYLVLKQHPGGGDISIALSDSEEVPAKDMCHIYNQDRSSQVRGLSELTSSLLPAALLRSFTLAVVKASNIAASLSFLVHTDEIGEESTACSPYDVMDLEHGTGMALPDGYKPTQLKAEQPVENYGDFKNEMLNEVGRGMLMPRLKVSGDASAYNYSSGRLDGQEYYHAIDVERTEIERRFLDKWFAAWWQEAVTVPGFLSPAAKAVVKDDDYPAYPRHRWGWDGRPHVDPEKEAKAEVLKLQNGLTGLNELYAARNLNFETEMEKNAKTYGLTVDEFRKVLLSSIHPQETANEENEESDGQDDSGESPDESKESDE